jgi:inner membrane protein
MDNLTHTLTGILLARAGLSRLTPRAAWICALAANVPDIDIVALTRGVETYFSHHRGITHAIVAAPVMAMLPVLVVAAVTRHRLPWLGAWVASLIAVASHLLLDLTNAYGIRLWLPWSDAWPALDATSVIDIWIWAVLLIGCLWPMLSGLVSSEIGGKTTRGRGAAIAALVFLLVYDTGRWFLRGQAIATMDTRLYDGAPARRTLVFPHMVNPMRWKGWVETQQAWLAIDVDLMEEYEPAPVATYWKTGAHPAIDAARALPIFGVLSKFARTPDWRVTPADEPPGSHRVELVDLRFVRDGQAGFTAFAVVDSGGHVVESGFHY